MKVAILGGSFNPPHKGHFFIAQQALKNLRPDQIWIVPTLENPLKERSENSFEERLKMCEEFFAKNPKIKVKNHKDYSISTFELIKKLRTKNPETEFYFLMGEDSLINFHKWKNFKKLIKIIKFVVFSRKKSRLHPKKTKICQIYNGFTVKNKENLPKFTFVKSKNINISSSEIRG